MHVAFVELWKSFQQGKAGCASFLLKEHVLFKINKCIGIISHCATRLGGNGKFLAKIAARLKAGATYTFEVRDILIE